MNVSACVAARSHVGDCMCDVTFNLASPLYNSLPSRLGQGEVRVVRCRVSSNGAIANHINRGL